MSDDDDDDVESDFLIKQGLNGILVLAGVSSPNFSVMRILASSMAQMSSVVEAGDKGNWSGLPGFLQFLTALNNALGSIGAGELDETIFYTNVALSMIPGGDDDD